MTEYAEIRKDLNRLFAHKAEWLKERIFDLFTAPDYLSSLSVDVPCVLEGGRGTGKTTVLRGLSYIGLYALSDKQPLTIRGWQHIGFYLRVDTNRVNAFSGPEVTAEKWQQLFAHYLNLVFCDLVLEFLEWYAAATGENVKLSHIVWERFSQSLCIVVGGSVKEVRTSISNAIVDFEVYVNNIEDEPHVRLSLQGAPVDLLIKAVSSEQEFKHKTFSFLIDEYENLNPSQQQVTNTLIKHASNEYTFKIGVRELGWKCKTTLNVNEHLVSPADYRLINITDELNRGDFAKFAQTVCDVRLNVLRETYPDIPLTIVDLFPGLTQQEEALKLGVGPIAAKISLDTTAVSQASSQFFQTLEPLQKYFLKLTADRDGENFEKVVEAAAKNGTWATNFDNYSHALLFTLRRGKRGIRKFYCGWRVLCLLANANLRYLIELVDNSIAAHLSDGREFTHSISVENQTTAAQRVGKKNLAELEGLTDDGAKLTKLLLGMGRVLGIMAEDVSGHAPEVNQFKMADETMSMEVEHLLKNGVMHLALVRFTGTKVAGFDTKDYDYSLHPIFAPFFGFSHRKKRKMTITGQELLSLVNDTPRGVNRILAKSHRTPSNTLPDQLTLFEKYFDEHPQ